MAESTRPSTRSVMPSATFVARYNAEWLIEKNGLRSPSEQ